MSDGLGKSVLSVAALIALIATAGCGSTTSSGSSSSAASNSTASIVAGLRVSAGLGWQSLIGAELIVASTGIGYMMVQAQLNIFTTTVMSSMLAIGLVGFGIDVVLRWIETTVRRHGLA